MPIPPRVSVVALRTADLARSTAFYVALGWELSSASTAAMSLFKTAGSLLLVCTDELLTELGGPEVAAALAGQPTGEAVLSIHVATDGEVDAALQEAAQAGGVVVKRTAPTPLAPGTGRAGAVTEVDQLVGGLLDPQPLGQRGGQQQSGMATARGSSKMDLDLVQHDVGGSHRKGASGSR